MISGEDDHWKVELDVTDFGGHLDTTLRGQGDTIAGRIRKEIVQLAAVGASPLGVKAKTSNLADQVWATGSVRS